jgi:hypothetical protein
MFGAETMVTVAGGCIRHRFAHIARTVRNRQKPAHGDKTGTDRHREASQLLSWEDL